MTRELILKQKVNKRNRDEYLKAHPRWFEDFMNMESPNARSIKANLK